MVALLCLIASGCTEAPPPATEARAAVKRYYELIQESRLDDAVQFYAPEDQGRWREFLERWQRDLGALRKVETHTVETHTTFSGTLYLCISETEYGQGEASEIVTLRTAVNEEGLKIVSHEIDPY